MMLDKKRFDLVDKQNVDDPPTLNAHSEHQTVIISEKS